jgi:hypothetical protein
MDIKTFLKDSCLELVLQNDPRANQHRASRYEPERHNDLYAYTPSTSPDDFLLVNVYNLAPGIVDVCLQESKCSIQNCNRLHRP